MKRIFIGLMILLLQFIMHLPWENLFYPIGIIDYDNVFTALGVLLIVIITIAVFLSKTHLKDRLDTPAPGMILITIGTILSISIWTIVITAIATFLVAVMPNTGIAFFGLLAFTAQYGTQIEVCNTIANILLVIGFYRLFIHLGTTLHDSCAESV